MRLDTHSATKSVPPVEAPAFSAMAMDRPEMKPPKITSIILSPSSGAKLKTLRKSDESPTCIMEKMTKRLLMEPQHSAATGMFSSSMPTEVEMCTPPSEVIWLTRTATPVKPLGSRLAGSTNAWMRKVCSSAENVTAIAVMMRRTTARRASSSARSVMASTAFRMDPPWGVVRRVGAGLFEMGTVVERER